MVAFTDTPELFGGEIRILAAIDFKDGKVVRWIDYWDGRSFGAEAAAKIRTPPDKFPTNFDYDVASDGASAKIKDVVAEARRRLRRGRRGGSRRAVQLRRRLSRPRVARAHSRQSTRSGNIWRACWPTVPYGKGSKLMHVVGSDQGGGYEWTNADSSVKRGIVAIDLNSAGQIERLDTTWDNGVMSDADLQALVLQSIEK